MLFLLSVNLLTTLCPWWMEGALVTRKSGFVSSFSSRVFIRWLWSTLRLEPCRPPENTRAGRRPPQKQLVWTSSADSRQSRPHQEPVSGEWATCDFPGPQLRPGRPDIRRGEDCRSQGSLQRDPPGRGRAVFLLQRDPWWRRNASGVG